MDRTSDKEDIFSRLGEDRQGDRDRRDPRDREHRDRDREHRDRDHHHDRDHDRRQPFTHEQIEAIKQIANCTSAKLYSCLQEEIRDLERMFRCFKEATESQICQIRRCNEQQDVRLDLLERGVQVRWCQLEGQLGCLSTAIQQINAYLTYIPSVVPQLQTFAVTTNIPAALTTTGFGSADFAAWQAVSQKTAVDKAAVVTNAASGNTAGVDSAVNALAADATAMGAFAPGVVGSPRVALSPAARIGVAPWGVGAWGPGVCAPGVGPYGACAPGVWGPGACAPGCGPYGPGFRGPCGSPRVGCY